METMTVRTKYVITDTEQLISPAGYNLDQPVYEQTKIAIHTDRLNIRLPKGVKLYGHNVKALIEKHKTPDFVSLEKSYKIYLDLAGDGKGGDITRDGKPLKTYQEWVAV